SMAMISAEETESETAAQTVTEEGDTVTAEVPAEDEKPAEAEKKDIKDDPVYKCLIESGYSPSAIGAIEDVELNGKYFSEPVTSIDLLKKTVVSHLILKDMKDFDLALLKELKYLKILEIKGMVTVKNIEALGELNLSSIKVDSKGSETESFVRKEDVYPYIKVMDITVKKGELKPFSTSPDFYPGYGYENRLDFECEDKSIALLVSDTMAGEHFVPKVSNTVFDGETFVYGYEVGETTYTYKDRNGNIIGKAKIIVEAADDINDPALIKNDIKPVKVLNVSSYEETHMAYVLYDNGSLYTFKDGALEEYQKNIKDAAINGSDIYALSEDGVLYINGKAVNKKSEYTVVSGSKTLKSILCSDGCIRIISDDKEAELALENIKTMDESFGRNHVMSGIVQDEDGITSVVYRALNGKYIKYPLEEKFEPVRISFKNPTLNGGLYYVFTTDKKIYEITGFFPTQNIPGFDTLADTEVSVDVKLFAEDVEDMYDSEYITSDGITHSTYAGESAYDEDYILLNDMIDLCNTKVRWYDLFDSKGNKVSRVSHYMIDQYGEAEKYSVRDNEGTEIYSFIKDSKPLTHVKLDYGMYKDGNNKCVLIQREDNTLWKYVVETGELVRLDEAITGSEVLNSTDPEPEKAEPKEPSENENKDGEPEKAAPDKKNESGNTAGDISGDGQVDVTDLTMISLGLLGDLTLNETQRQFADVNHDGKVDLADLATLRQFLSKKIDTLG
ncbi:MAG: dockerin type I repeat-containing protein, partial [Oscillospiraceae bacterium]|nr:dockerin type I repeat-containing protein [Oscillospiraceae bacterium]